MLLGVLAWLVAHAKSDVVKIAADGSDGTGIGGVIEPDRAGRLVPGPMPEPEVSRSLFAHWALWAAAILIVALLAVGYVRRRLRTAAQQRSAHVAWARQAGEPKRKD